MATLPPTSDPEQTLHGDGPGGVDADDSAGCEGEDFSQQTDYRLAGLDNRERALPFRQGDLTRLLLAEPGLGEEEREKLRQLGRLLGATFHSEFYGKLSELKELYAPLDPDSDYVHLRGATAARTGHSDEDFLVPFEATLTRANYRPLALQAIEEAVAAPNEMGLTYTPDFTLFEHLRVYVRGYTRIVRDCRTVKTKFRKRTVSFDAYQRLIVALKFKETIKLGPLVRPDVVYLKMYKDVPHVDMEMHLPEQGTRVRMRWIDKAQIASPLVMGIPTLAVKLIAAAALSPMALGGLIVAPISAGVNSFFGFQRAKQKHMMTMIQKLYYLTLANNASVLTRLVDSAEDEEYKEAVLAYFFLWRAIGTGEPWNVSRLDAHIERYLTEKTGVSINFEVADALTKLLRLGLAHRDPQGMLHATPIDQALQALDRRWDDTFRYP